MWSYYGKCKANRCLGLLVELSTAISNHRTFHLQTFSPQHTQFIAEVFQVGKSNAKGFYSAHYDCIRLFFFLHQWKCNKRKHSYLSISRRNRILIFVAPCIVRFIVSYWIVERCKLKRLVLIISFHFLRILQKKVMNFFSGKKDLKSFPREKI